MSGKTRVVALTLAVRIGLSYRYHRDDTVEDACKTRVRLGPGLGGVFITVHRLKAQRAFLASAQYHV